ncbi:MAG: HAD-IC family P-type ATPase, partial [Phycisphaerales bacterium]
MPFEEVLRALGSSPRGLAVQDAARRLAIDGPNALPDPVRVPLLRTMLRQLRSPLAGILLAAAALSLVMGSHADAAFIAAVLLVNATIGGVQEWRAECGAHALRRMLRAHATVVRGGEAVEIDAREIVRGDLILLEPGASVPADGRLASAEGLEVDESLLTGESAPAAKDACAEAGPRTQPLADRASMVHAGTTVSRGRATAVVVATAGRTALGTLARDVERASRGKPPLVLRLERFTRVVGTACVVAAAAVALIGWLAQGHPPAHMAVFAVALAVSIVPEGLPVAITIALSIASRRMSRRGVIVRRLDAVEGLGSCTMILSDKTGTLTCNELTVREVRLPSRRRLEMSGQGFVPEGDLVPPRDGLDAEDRERLVRLVDGMVLCNEASLGNDGGSWRWRGDPTDIALLCFARKLGVSRDALLAERPESRRTCFEPEQRFASSVHDLHGTPWIHATGAPERIDAMCAANARPDLAAAREMAAAGLRVLAVADGPAERCG